MGLFDLVALPLVVFLTLVILATALWRRRYAQLAEAEATVVRPGKNAARKATRSDTAQDATQEDRSDRTERAPFCDAPGEDESSSLERSATREGPPAAPDKTEIAAAAAPQVTAATAAPGLKVADSKATATGPEAPLEEAPEVTAAAPPAAPATAPATAPEIVPESPPEASALEVQPFVPDESEAAVERRRLQVEQIVNEHLKARESDVDDVTELMADAEKDIREKEEAQWYKQERERIENARTDGSKKESTTADGAGDEEEKKIETPEEKMERLTEFLSAVKERVFSAYAQSYKERKRAEGLKNFKLEKRRRAAPPQQVFPGPEPQLKSDSDDGPDEDALEDFAASEASSTNSEHLADLFERTVWDLHEEEIEKYLDSEVAQGEENAANSADSQKWKESGNEKYRSKDYWGAAEDYTKALVRCSSPAEIESRAVAQILGNLAAVKLALGDYNGCTDDSTDSLEFDPTYTKAWLRRAKAREANGAYHEALEDLRKAVELEPSLSKEYAASLTRLEKLSKEKFEREKEELMKQLKTFGNWALGKVGLSLDNFKLEQNPDTGSYNIQFVQGH